MKLLISRKTLLFYIALFFWITLNYLGNTTILIDYGRFLQIFSRILKVVVATCLLLKIISDRYSAKRLLIYFLITIISLISCIRTNWSEDILWLTLFTISTRDIDFDKTVRFYMRLSLIYLFMTVFLAVFGFIDNISMIASSLFNGATITRHLIGFKHVNYLGGYIFSIYCGFLYLRYDKLKARNYFLSVAISLFLYFYVNSKTSAFLILLSIIFTVLFKLFSYGKIKPNIIRNVTYITLIISVGVSIYAAVFYNSLGSQVTIIDGLLSYRLKWGNYFFEKYGFSLFGQEIELISSQQASELGVSSSILDNAYMHLMIHYGIIIFLIVMICYFLLAKFAFKQGKYKICLYVTIMAMCGITEKWLFMLTYNYLLLAFIPVFDEAIISIRSRKKKVGVSNVRTRKITY